VSPSISSKPNDATAVLICRYNDQTDLKCAGGVSSSSNRLRRRFGIIQFPARPNFHFISCKLGYSPGNYERIRGHQRNGANKVMPPFRRIPTLLRVDRSFSK
jgi:hypothetical protein